MDFVPIVISVLDEAKYRIDQLNRLERLIRKLKDNPRDTQVCREIAKTLKLMFGYLDVKFRVLYNEHTPNAFVLYVPNPFRSKIEDKRPHIAMSVQFYVTKGLLDLLTTREVVAVLLHEVGHTFYSGKPLFQQLLSTIRRLLYLGTMITAAVTHLPIFALLLSTLTLSLQLEVGVGLLSRLSEKDADKFVVELGYGPELATALQKLSVYAKFQEGKKTGFFSKVWDKIKQIFDTHPNNAERICHVLKTVIDEYPEQLKGELKTLYEKYCKNAS